MIDSLVGHYQHSTCPVTTLSIESIMSTDPELYRNYTKIFTKLFKTTNTSEKNEKLLASLDIRDQIMQMSISVVLVFLQVLLSIVIGGNATEEDLSQLR